MAYLLLHAVKPVSDLFRNRNHQQITSIFLNYNKGQGMFQQYVRLIEVLNHFPVLISRS